MTDNESTARRFAEIESALTHLQHDVEQLNAVILDQSALIQKLERRLDRLEGRVDDLGIDDRHDPLDERPPHY